MAEFLLPFQRTAIEPKIPPFNEYGNMKPPYFILEPNYVHNKQHLVSKIQTIPIDEGELIVFNFRNNAC